MEKALKRGTMRVSHAESGGRWNIVGHIPRDWSSYVRTSEAPVSHLPKSSPRLGTKSLC